MSEHDEALTQTRRRGLNLTPMSEDGSIFIPLSTPQPLSEHPRDEKLIRSVSEHDAIFAPAGGG